MIIYFLAYLYFCFGEVCIFLNKKKAIEKVYIFLILLFMCFYSGLRKSDIDYKNYFKIYYGLLPMASYGYEVLVSISKSIGFSYSEFLFILNLINIILLYKLFYYENEQVYVSLIIYFGYFFLIKNMNQYRNLLALLLVYNFVKDIFYKKKVGFSIIYILGILIHSSSIIILCLPILNFFKTLIEKRIKIILKIILATSLVLYRFNILKRVIDFIIFINIPQISEKIRAYMYTSLEYSGIKHTLGIRDFKYFILAIIIIYLIDSKETIFYKKVLIIGFFLGIFIKWSLSFNSILSDRLSEVFLILEPLLLGMIYQDDFSKKKKIVYIFLIATVIMYNLFQAYFPMRNIINTFY